MRIKRIGGVTVFLFLLTIASLLNGEDGVVGISGSPDLSLESGVPVIGTPFASKYKQRSKSLMIASTETTSAEIERCLYIEACSVETRSQENPDLCSRSAGEGCVTMINPQPARISRVTRRSSVWTRRSTEKDTRCWLAAPASTHHSLAQFTRVRNLWIPLHGTD